MKIRKGFMERSLCEGLPLAEAERMVSGLMESEKNKQSTAKQSYLRRKAKLEQQLKASIEHRRKLEAELETYYRTPEEKQSLPGSRQRRNRARQRRNCGRGSRKEFAATMAESQKAQEEEWRESVELVDEIQDLLNQEFEEEIEIEESDREAFNKYVEDVGDAQRAVTVALIEAKRRRIKLL